MKNNIRPFFYIFNIDVVNAKSGKKLSLFDKLANGLINVIASVAFYVALLFAGIFVLNLKSL
jgi:hypothetical protein